MERLKDYLDARRIKYVTINHSPAYTSQEVAASAHIPGRKLAKPVIVKLDGRLAMAVLAAPDKIDLDRLRDAAGARSAGLAAEQEFESRFPDCELGAMPPFGNLYGMEVFLARSLAEQPEIAFEAGSHSVTMMMQTRDFIGLAEPRVLDFCRLA